MQDIDRSDGAVERAAIRGAVTGTIIATVAMTVGVTVVMLYAGAQLVPAVGVGLFAAVWGGPGFGGMMGAILAAVRAEAAIAAAEASVGMPGTPDAIAPVNTGAPQEAAA